MSRREGIAIKTTAIFSGKLRIKKSLNKRATHWSCSHYENVIHTVRRDRSWIWRSFLAACIKGSKYLFKTILEKSSVYSVMFACACFRMQITYHYSNADYFCLHRHFITKTAIYVITP